MSQSRSGSSEVPRDCRKDAVPARIPVGKLENTRGILGSTVSLERSLSGSSEVPGDCRNDRVLVAIPIGKLRSTEGLSQGPDDHSAPAETPRASRRDVPSLFAGIFNVPHRPGRLNPSATESFRAFSIPLINKASILQKALVHRARIPSEETPRPARTPSRPRTALGSSLRHDRLVRTDQSSTVGLRLTVVLGLSSELSASPTAGRVRCARAATQATGECGSRSRRRPAGWARSGS